MRVKVVTVICDEVICAGWGDYELLCPSRRPDENEFGVFCLPSAKRQRLHLFR